MKFSLRLNNDLPIDTYVAAAMAAEAAGFDQFWVSNDLFIRSAPIILAAVAARTSRIEIGTCILNPYTINPAEIAMMAATLDDYSGGRFNLGLSSGADDFLGWIGITAQKPRTAVIETVKVVNRLLSGERASLDGDFLQWKDDSYLRFEPSRRVPIYLGAMSPNMLRAIGQVADGGLPLLFPPEHYANVLPYIKEGAQQAGRDLAEIDIAACIWCSISADGDAARDALAEKVAYYGHAMSPLIYEQLGLTVEDFSEIRRIVVEEDDLPRAKSLVTPPMLKIGIAGTAHDLIERLELLAERGVNHISFGPPLGPEPLAAIQEIGAKVIPHFRKS
jgi:5,10-methylenetetrahydromethanopterin reductase